MMAARKKNVHKMIVYDQKGRKAGECLLPAEIFYARVNHRLLHQVEVAYAANRRRGTADTKTRAEVRGGGKKPWKQKGTGRARHGSIRSPIWRGGGVTFGPHPRKYTQRIPVQLRRQALISALSLKLSQGKLMVIDGVKLEKPKTKEWATVLEALKLAERRTLCMLNKPDEGQKRASKNLGYCLHLQSADQCSAYEVLKNDHLLLDKNAIPRLEERLLGASSEGGDELGAREEAVGAKA